MIRLANCNGELAKIITSIGHAESDGPERTTHMSALLGIGLAHEFIDYIDLDARWANS